MKNLLIIGAGSAGRMVANEIMKHNTIKDKYNICGFVDDDKNKKELDGLPVLGSINDLHKVIKSYNISEVIIAIPSAESSTVKRILNLLSDASVLVKIVPGIYEIIEGKVTLNQIRNIEPEDLLGRQEIGFDIDKISSFYKDKKILITGGGGSIGSEILIQLLKLPVINVIALGHGENSIHTVMNRVLNDKKFKYIIADIKDYNKIDHEFKITSPDIIFHAAAHKHVPLMEEYPDEAVKNNIIGTYNCAKSAINNNVKKFIFISTDKAVNPTSVMGATKRIAEKIVLSLNNIQNKTDFSLTRFGNVLSSRGSVVPIFKKQIEEGGPVTVTHPEITRYFMSIPEAARLVIKSAASVEGRIYILDMGMPIKIYDLAKNMIKLYGYNEDDIKIKFTGLRKGEKMYEELFTNNEEKLLKSDFNKLLVSLENNDLLDEAGLDIMIKEFKEISESYDNNKIRLLLKKYVPEYKLID